MKVHQILGDSYTGFANDTALMPGPPPDGGPTGFNDYKYGSYQNNQDQPAPFPGNSVVNHNLTAGILDDTANGGPPNDGAPWFKLEKRDTDPSAPNFDGSQSHDRVEFQMRNIPQVGLETWDGSVRWWTQERWIPSSQSADWRAPFPGGGNYIMQWHTDKRVPIRLDMLEVIDGGTRGGLLLAVQVADSNDNYVDQKQFSDTNIDDYFGKVVKFIVRYKLHHTTGEVDVWVKKDGVITKLFEFRAGQGNTLGADDSKAINMGSSNASFQSRFHTGSYMNGLAERTMAYRSWYQRWMTYWEGEHTVEEVDAGSSPTASSGGGYGVLQQSVGADFAGEDNPSVAFSAPSAGDLIVAYISVGEGRTISNPSTGFQEVLNQTAAGNAAGMWYKESDGTETSFDVDLSSNGFGRLLVEVWSGSGLDFASAGTDTDTANPDTSVQTRDFGSVTLSTASGLALGFIGSDSHGAITNGRSYGGGFAEQSFYSGALSSGLVTAKKQIDSTTTTGSFATTSGGDQMLGALLAIPALATASLSAPTAQAESQATASATVVSSNSGDVHAVITDSVQQPSVAQIEAGQDHTGTAVGVGKHQTVTGSGLLSFSFTGLTPSETGFVHFTDGTNRASSSQFSTPGTALSGASASASSSSSISAGVVSDSEREIYAVALDAATATPSEAAVISDSNAVSVIGNGNVTGFSFTGLAVGDYKVHFAASGAGVATSGTVTLEAVVATVKTPLHLYKIGSIWTT